MKRLGKMCNTLSRDEVMERLDFALKSAGIGAYGWDLPEGIMRWDTQMYVLFGLEPGVRATGEIADRTRNRESR
jgi:hypothetical protein